ncbi:hypothetical protein JCM10213_002018 [Rhodosporidiobolus nylandii]
MLRAAATRTGSQGCLAPASAVRQLLPRTTTSLRAVLRPSNPVSGSLLTPKRLASTSSTASNTPPPPRRRLLPVLAASSLALLGGLYLYSTREEPAVLASDRWTPVKIQSVERLTPETSLFRLEVPRSLLPQALEGDPTARPILSLFVKEPNLQIQRAYTPLSATSFSSSGPTTLDLVIKRYSDGEASRYLHRLGPGDEMIVRGPSVTWYYRPEEWDEVVFVVGGTGVSPAYQLLHDTFLPSNASSPSPSLNVVYASPSPSRILLRQELDALTARADEQKDVKVQYLVDRLDAESGKAGLPTGTEVGFLDKKKLEKAIGRRGQQGKRRVVVVCGPEGMLNAVAGPRGRNFSQGPVGGILQELGYTSKEVVKL